MCNDRRRTVTRSVAILVLAVAASGCLPASRRETPSARVGPTHLERLYFGRNIADTAVVTIRPGEPSFGMS